jgi:3-hydroxybutyryl-CoA dehydratase
MNRLFDACATMSLTPLLLYHAAAHHLTQSMVEQVAAAGKLLDSVVGRPVFREDAVQAPARDEDLFVGKSLSLTKTVADLHTACFGVLSLDFNPLHFNETQARRTRFEGRIAHGIHTASLFSGVLADLTPWCVYLHQEMDFTGPVRAGDVITATGTIQELDAKGVVQVALVCRNQRQEVVVRGRAFVKKLREMYVPAGMQQEGASSSQ